MTLKHYFCVLCGEFSSGGKMKIILVLFIFLLSAVIYAQGQNYIKGYLVIGTFPNTDTETILSKEYIPNEGDVIPSAGEVYAGREWKVVEFAEEGRVDFTKLGFDENEYCVVYAFVYVYSESERNVKIYVGSDDGVSVYVNGKKVFYNLVWRGWSPNQDRVFARIGKGWNRLLFKVFNGSGGFDLSARITDVNNKQIPSLKYSVENPFKGQKYIEPEVQPWVVCDKTEFSEEFVNTESGFVFPLKLYLKNLGTVKLEKLDVVLKGLNTIGNEVVKTTFAIDLREDTYNLILLKEKEVLTLLKDADKIEIDIEWAEHKEVSEIRLNKKNFLNAVLKTESKSIPSRIREKFDYLNKNLRWAFYFGGSKFRVTEEYIYEVTKNFFGDDWKSLEAKLDDQVNKIKEIEPEIKKNTIYFTGNAHIDMAWLWKFEETVQVCYETFASALNFADKYDFFVYSQSQAQAYWWMENRFPVLFKNIREKVRKGQWELIGGMWVEPDLNIPSGEALARQLLYGKRYFLEKFGVDIKVGYNPDTFGYCWTLPQIFKKAGIDYFITQKIGWNDTNKFPHRAFWWQGLDGTKILTFFPHTYVHNADPFRTAVQFREYQNTSGKNDQLVLYGVGNHGGGPTQKNINNIQEMKKIDAFPTVVESSALNFMETLNEKYDEFPTWNDELYLEYHRGTYTTQANTKKNNRKSEILCEEAEKLSIISGIKYPEDEINEAWRLTLFNQFHDILPGSSINEVYKDADVQYNNVRKLSNRVINRSIDKIINSINYKSEGIPIVVFNPLSWERSDVAKVDVPDNYQENMELYDNKGKEVVYEVVDGEIYFTGESIPPLGYKTFYLREGNRKKAGHGVKITENSIENEYLKITVESETGNILSIFDKVNKREILEKDKGGNVLEAFEDIPSEWDAWNIGYTGEEWKIENVKNISVKSESPLKSVLSITREFNKSRFVQDLILYRRVPRLDIENRVDWNESNVMVKAAFNLNINSDYATFEIPYGTIKRAAIPKNKFDEAKFEVSGHKWIDMTDDNHSYGVSLLNDSKYGFDLKGSKIRITLLRSPKWPDPKADMGNHTFIYSIYPHKACWKEGKTFYRAYELNYPLIAKVGENSKRGSKKDEFSYVVTDNPNVIITAVKKAEDRESIILRFYEIHGKETDVKLIFNRSLKKVEETDLIERPLNDLNYSGNEVIVKTKPYEIKTLSIEF